MALVQTVLFGFAPTQILQAVIGDLAVLVPNIRFVGRLLIGPRSENKLPDHPISPLVVFFQPHISSSITQERLESDPFICHVAPTPPPTRLDTAPCVDSIPWKSRHVSILGFLTRMRIVAKSDKMLAHIAQLSEDFRSLACLGLKRQALFVSDAFSFLPKRTPAHYRSLFHGKCF